MTEAPKRLIVTVTQEDIDHGTQGDCARCPIARAVVRELAPYYPDDAVVHATVGSLAATYTDSSEHPEYAYELSQAAREFIRAFDTGHSVKPALFTLTFYGKFEGATAHDYTT